LLLPFAVGCGAFFGDSAELARASRRRASIACTNRPLHNKFEPTLLTRRCNVCGGVH
jgi:hypothetical protein